MTVSTFANSHQQFPTLRFGAHPWWTRFYHGICFLPHAFRVIKERNLTPSYSFHFLDAQEHLIGISDGDIRYPGTEAELARLQPLIVHLEDRRFYRHSGIDLRAIVRAMTANLRSWGIVQGGST